MSDFVISNPLSDSKDLLKRTRATSALATLKNYTKMLLIAPKTTGMKNGKEPFISLS